ncbi:hypothetical protein JTB14_029735 [Gonioctena quinquepunctata]|nr:hypothetical protein JTB14_029735 [Gonioctena quinquepunctata]
MSGVMDNVSLDTMVVGMLLQSAVQVKILKNNLQFLEDKDEKEIDIRYDTNMSRDDLKAKLDYKYICRSIDHYDAILQYAKDVANVYSVAISSQLFASIVVICISCLQLSIVQPFTFVFFGMVTYIVTMLMQVFIYCYYGTLLYEESNSLNTAIYMSKWYNYDHKSKKSLITLMERAKRPIELTAGKFFVLSLDTFTMVAGEDLKPMDHVARKFFCIQATSAESERVFSLTGQLIEQRRSRLNPKKSICWLF